METYGPQTVPADQAQNAEASAVVTADCSYCGTCQHACPRNLPLLDFLQVRAALEVGELDAARSLHASLPFGGTLLLCDGCHRCSGACPEHLDTVGLIREALAQLA